MRTFWIRENLRTSLWFIPTVCVLLSILLAVVLGRLDARVDSGWLESFTFRGDADNARTFLTTIATSMITFTALVFTITIVVLQLASQQLSPRVLRAFLRDRLSQVSLGVFVATFTYSLVVLRELRPDAAQPGGQFVPNISITVGFALVLLSIAFFVAYIHHIAQSIRIGNLAELIAQETDDAIHDIYDHDEVASRVEAPHGPPDQVIVSKGRGVLAAVDRDGLVAVAAGEDAVVKVIPAVGDFVPRGAPVMEVYGTALSEDVAGFLALAPERTMAQDPAFGFRQLVDIAQKALSPAVNDPTTAVQAIDLVHDLLRRLATRPFPSGQRADNDGKVRLFFPVMTWDAYVHLACDELRHYGATSLQVMRRLRAMLEDVHHVAPAERKPVLEKQIGLLDTGIARTWADVEDQRLGAIADAQGLGD